MATLTHLTTAMASNNGSNFVQANAAFAGTNATGTIASNGISISVNAGGAGDGYNIIGVNGNSVGSAATIQFSNSNNVTFGLAGSTITASASYPAQTAFVFSNSNGVSFGTNGSTVTATVATNYQSQGAYLTTARASNDAIGLNTAATSVTWTVNSSGISLNAGAYLTTAAQSNHSHGNPTLNLTNLSGTTASASNGFTLSLSAAAPVGGGGAAISAGANSQSTGTVNFANSNGITFGLSNNGTMTASHNGLTSQSNQAFSASGGSSAFQTLNFANSNGVTFSNSNGSVIASHNGLTTARASNDGVGLNTAQTNVTWTVNSNGISINGAGYAGTGTSATNASITMNSNGLAISVAAPGGGGAINVSAGTTSGNLQTLQFNNLNGVSFGLNGSTVTASVGAGGGATVSSHFEGLNNITLMSGANAAISVVRFVAPYHITATQVAFPLYQSISSSATANTYGQQWSVGVGVYTNDTVNNRLMSLSLGNTNTSYTLASNTAGATQIIGSGVRPITCPININMTPGVYYMAFVFSTGLSSVGTATTGLNRTASFLGRGAIMSASYAMVSDYTQATGVTNNRFWPQGVIAGASSSLPLTISHSQITMTGASNSAANIAFYFRA